MNDGGGKTWSFYDNNNLVTTSFSDNDDDNNNNNSENGDGAEEDNGKEKHEFFSPSIAKKYLNEDEFFATSPAAQMAMTPGILSNINNDEQLMAEQQQQQQQSSSSPGAYFRAARREALPSLDDVFLMEKKKKKPKNNNQPLQAAAAAGGGGGTTKSAKNLLDDALLNNVTFKKDNKSTESRQFSIIYMTCRIAGGGVSRKVRLQNQSDRAKTIQVHHRNEFDREVLPVFPACLCLPAGCGGEIEICYNSSSPCSKKAGGPQRRGPRRRPALQSESELRKKRSDDGDDENDQGDESFCLVFQCENFFYEFLVIVRLVVSILKTPSPPPSALFLACSCREVNFGHVDIVQGSSQEFVLKNLHHAKLIAYTISVVVARRRAGCFSLLKKRDYSRVEPNQVLVLHPGGEAAFALEVLPFPSDEPPVLYSCSLFIEATVHNTTQRLVLPVIANVL